MFERRRMIVDVFDGNLNGSKRDITRGECLEKIQIDPTIGTIAEFLFAEFFSIDQLIGCRQRLIISEKKI